MAAASATSREVQLVRRPSGMPVEDDFRLVETPLRAPADGELLVRNSWLSVDPYMRIRMDDGDGSYMPPYELGVALDGPALGEVVESGSPDFAPGDVVMHELGWRELALVPAKIALPVDTGSAPLSTALGVLGWTGYTAHYGLLDVAGLREGDVVFVSGAAGAVGSAAGQIARLRGHRVIGSAGGAAKVAHLRDELGFDAAFDYRAGDLAGQLRAAAPEGIDVYFDNVGGEHLEAALACMNDGGRVAMCGAIAGYSATEPPRAPRNLFQVTAKQLRLQGFLVDYDPERWTQFAAEVGRWVERGELVYRETVSEGVENAVAAFLGMLGGANVGKALVRL